MTVENTQSHAGDPFAYLYPYDFALLTTFRKNGDAVPTTMWFAHDQGKLYMVTSATVGKIKRIRNNGRVLLAPCDVGGKVLGSRLKPMLTNCLQLNMSMPTLSWPANTANSTK